MCCQQWQRLLACQVDDRLLKGDVMSVSIAQKQSDTPPAGEREEDKLCVLRAAIEPAWEQARQGNFADYTLEKSLKKLRKMAKASG